MPVPKSQKACAKGMGFREDPSSRQFGAYRCLLTLLERVLAEKLVENRYEPLGLLDAGRWPQLEVSWREPSCTRAIATFAWE